MTAEQRRESILQELKKSEKPLSATTLSQIYGVSRQIIVGDVALLRAGGIDISATPRGYQINTPCLGIRHQIACFHENERTEEELMICIDHGCTVLDVIVEHPLYGQIVGALLLTTPYDIRQFVTRMKADRAHSLCELTDGIHLHTLSCPSEEAYQLTIKALDEAGFLLKT